MSRPPYSEHPENDLHSDADYANRYRPEPHSWEELASSQDPLAQLEENQRSTRQAIAYALGMPLLLVTLSLASLVANRIIGGPLCDPGPRTWICTEAFRLWWPIATSFGAFIIIVGCAVIMVHKLRTYTRWRPWMGAFWFLVPMGMLWMTTVLPIAILGHPLS
ncbi:hypothetical protein GP475_12045 [Corynebacterium poyangense]|uniref:Uncharacterized protein n=1 Tax=Corynebacterium poyangense TaxID=2684405 RepID=A0A7H0SRV8_9CORY|nr:hypothetical protein [Corynebacterium poyangense]MBZ8177223.1 hypothetical protein [Corynebacterium poyangense]QNQ91283.1 hypothetical protein GP475_12045 [Corynebacterium poyangense]